MIKPGITNIVDYIPSIAAGITLFIVFGPLSMMIFPLLAVTSFILVMYKRKTKEHNKDMCEIGDSIKVMRSINGNINRGANLATSIENAVQDIADDSAIKRILLSIRQRTIFGQDLSNAIDAEVAKNVRNGNINETLEPLKIEYNIMGSVRESAATVALSQRKRYEEIKEKEDGGLPRYLIIGMVVSAILPSMATFAFVGYSILSYSAFLLLLYCTLMLGVLPNFYSALRIKLSWLYNG